eukprot:Awhi_evm1s3767
MSTVGQGTEFLITLRLESGSRSQLGKMRPKSLGRNCAVRSVSCGKSDGKLLQQFKNSNRNSMSSPSLPFGNKFSSINSDNHRHDSNNNNSNANDIICSSSNNDNNINNKKHIILSKVPVLAGKKKKDSKNGREGWNKKKLEMQSGKLDNHVEIDQVNTASFPFTLSTSTKDQNNGRRDDNIDH